MKKQRCQFLRLRTGQHSFCHILLAWRGRGHWWSSLETRYQNPPSSFQSPFLPSEAFTSFPRLSQNLYLIITWGSGFKIQDVIIQWRWGSLGTSPLDWNSWAVTTWTAIPQHSQHSSVTQEQLNCRGHSHLKEEEQEQSGVQSGSETQLSTLLFFQDEWQAFTRAECSSLGVVLFHS